MQFQVDLLGCGVQVAAERSRQRPALGGCSKARYGGSGRSRPSVRRGA